MPGCLPEFPEAGRPVAALFFPPAVALHIPTFSPARGAAPLNLARPAAPFTDGTIDTSAA